MCHLTRGLAERAFSVAFGTVFIFYHNSYQCTQTELKEFALRFVAVPAQPFFIPAIIPLLKLNGPSECDFIFIQVIKISGAVLKVALSIVFIDL